MLIHLDPVTNSFLRDHVVKGTPLLPTVMALDALVGAVVDLQPDDPLGTDTAHARAGVVELTDVEIGPPVLCPDGVARTVEVTAARIDEPATTGSPSVAGRAAMVDQRRVPAVTHYGAVVRLVGMPPPDAGPAPDPAAPLPLRPADIYPPYFHGPSMRVVGAAAVGRRSADSRLADGITSPSWSTGTTVTAPMLLELAMQTAGLWELVTTGRMMIPQRIERVTVRLPDARLARSEPPAAYARVDAVTCADGTTAFDARVVDTGGGVLVELTGYHTTDLGERVAGEVLARIRAANQVPQEVP